MQQNAFKLTIAVSIQAGFKNTFYKTETTPSAKSFRMIEEKNYLSGRKWGDMDPPFSLLA